jgi:hypothetical protein
MHKHAWFWAWLLLIFGLMLACQPDEDIPPATPTPIQPSPAFTASPSPSPSLSPEPGITPSPSPTVITGPASPTFPPTLTPSLTASPEPPTNTPAPTNTPGPYEHSIRPGDDCIAIVYQYGHVSLDVLNEFYRLNNMNGQCFLPSAGSRVLVPRPTFDPNNPGSIQAVAAAGTPIGPAILAIATYCAVPDDTLTSIALKNSTSNRKICELNPLPDGLDCRGCDFSQSDVGSCPNPPLLREGQCVNVPAPTPFPTSTATPNGQETLTPTPTHRPPMGVYPLDGSRVQGPVGLQWAGVGRLAENEFYVVNLRDETTGAVWLTATQSTYVSIPAEYQPGDAAGHTIVWSVSVQARQADGLFIPLGAPAAEYRFIWE